MEGEGVQVLGTLSQYKGKEVWGSAHGRTKRFRKHKDALRWVCAELKCGELKLATESVVRY